MTDDLIFVDATEPELGSHTGMTLLNVHGADRCTGQPCCIHHPSDHHMRTWPQHWRADRHLMERTCPHGVGHPDPDDRNPNKVHGCDGCCSTKARRDAWRRDVIAD